MAKFDHKFESSRQDWETPQWLFDKMDMLYSFDVDLAANENNAKCSLYLTEKDDALSLEWRGSCWLNPPYGISGKTRLSRWVEKSYLESLSPGCSVAVLLPARSNTIWWHRYCMHSKKIYFICGRPKFGNCVHGLPQPLAVVYFSGYNKSPLVGSITKGE